MKGGFFIYKILKETGNIDQANHLEKQTEKALIEIENQTDVDVRNMSEAEFYNFKLNTEIKGCIFEEVEVSE